MPPHGEPHLSTIGKEDILSNEECKSQSNVSQANKTNEGTIISSYLSTEIR